MTAPNSTPLDIGIHYGVPASVYHSDPCPQPSLSSSIARVLLDQSPAHAYLAHPRLGGEKGEATPAMNTGSIVHDLLSGGPVDFVLGNYDNYRSGAARAWRDSITANGKTPVLERDLEDARKIAASIRENVCNGGITNNPFAPHGRSEVTVVWKEKDAYCRARIDRLLVDPNGYADCWDWKVTSDVSPRSLLRKIVQMGYHIQAAHYLRGLSVALPSHVGRTSWTFAFVLDVAPYTVRRVCLSTEFLSAGAAEVGRAIRLWQHALATNEWPDGSRETLTLEAPAYLLHDDEISAS